MKGDQELLVTLTQSHPGYSAFPPRVVAACEVLQAGDGVDGMQLRVDVDGVDGDAALPLLQLGVVEAVGRELQGVARVGEIAIVVHRADRDVQKSCRQPPQTETANCTFLSFRQDLASPSCIMHVRASLFSRPYTHQYMYYQVWSYIFSFDVLSLKKGLHYESTVLKSSTERETRKCE